MVEILRFIIESNKKSFIKELLKKTLSKEDRIVFAYLFGSFLGTLPFRDIDVGIYMSEIHSSEHTAKGIALSLELEKIIGFPVEVHIINGAPSYFQFNVIQGELLYLRDEELWINFVDRTIRMYLDEKPLREQFLKEICL